MSLSNRVNFATSADIPNYPDFLDIQVKSFKDFLILSIFSAIIILQIHKTTLISCMLFSANCVIFGIISLFY